MRHMRMPPRAATLMSEVRREATCDARGVKERREEAKIRHMPRLHAMCCHCY